MKKYLSGVWNLIIFEKCNFKWIQILKKITSVDKICLNFQSLIYKCNLCKFKLWNKIFYALNLKSIIIKEEFANSFYLFQFYFPIWIDFISFGTTQNYFYIRNKKYSRERGNDEIKCFFHIFLNWLESTTAFTSVK